MGRKTNKHLHVLLTIQGQALGIVPEHFATTTQMIDKVHEHLRPVRGLEAHEGAHVFLQGLVLNAWEDDSAGPYRGKERLKVLGLSTTKSS